MTKSPLLGKEKTTLAGYSRFVVISILFLSLCSCKDQVEHVAPPPVKPVKLMQVQAGQVQISMSLPGRVRAARRLELSFKVSGPLEKLPIDEGQVIKKGDLIAQILPRDFQTAINEAKANAVEAEQQYLRYKELYSKRQVSKADFDRYRASRDVARARLEDAKNALEDTTLVAPFDGVIAKRYVENFEKVREKQPIAFLQLIDQLEILIDVPELMMAQFRESRSVDVTAEFDAVPGEKYPLTVKEFSTDADPATQTYQVVLTMEQPSEANILPGMTSKVTALSNEANITQDTVILIPAIAVSNDASNKNFVWLFDKENNTVIRKEVTIGELAGSKNIVIKEGLTGGEDIVIAGISSLKDGMKVRPWENQREGK